MRISFFCTVGRAYGWVAVRASGGHLVFGAPIWPRISCQNRGVVVGREREQREIERALARARVGESATLAPVSYTHLTLPTN